MKGHACCHRCAASDGAGHDGGTSRARPSVLQAGRQKSWGQLLTEFVGLHGSGKSYALVVGISRYDDYQSLPTANDPLRMRDFLINEAGFDYVHVLTDEKATKSRIEELMVDVLPDMIHANDRFLFYWSGHGVQRPNAIGGHVGYLPLANSPVDRYSTMISMGDVQRWDALLEAKQALFLLDACFSGLAGTVSQSGHRELELGQLDQPAHHIVSAGTGEEETIAGSRWGGSIFTDAILQGIRGEADAETAYPRDGVVSLSELIGYVKTRVANEAPAAGWTRGITPQLQDLRANTGEFFFLTNERKIAKLESEGARYQGQFEYGMPVMAMGRLGKPADHKPTNEAGVTEGPSDHTNDAPSIAKPSTRTPTAKSTDAAIAPSFANQKSSAGSHLLYDAISFEDIERPEISSVPFPSAYLRSRVAQELGATTTTLPHIRVGITFIEPYETRREAVGGTIIGSLLVSLPSLNGCTRELGPQAYRFSQPTTGIMKAINVYASDISGLASAGVTSENTHGPTGQFTRDGD